MRTRTILGLFVAAAFVAATPAWAGPEHDHAHGEPHAEKAHDAHHDDAHGDAHGDDHGGHHYYTDDDDHDGTPNWLDPDNNGEPNEMYVLPSLGFHLLNLALLLGVIGYFVRRPISDAVRSRALGIRNELVESAKLRDEAEARSAEVNARIDKIEDEVQRIRTEAQEEAEAEKAKLIERAHEEAERIATAAQRNIRDELTRARNSLRREAVELAVKLAENTLRDSVSADDQRRLAQDFLDSIKDDEVNGHA